jgi:predicted  nucleic acid-binding Zn-ribbon protein
MHPDLAALIELQRLDTLIDSARKVLAELPQRESAVEARLAEASARLDAARHRGAENQTARRTVEKDMAVIQGRLEKFKDQTRAVKTNKEFHALQHEIQVAQDEIAAFEDRILTFMVQADEIGADVKTAEAALAETKKLGDEERARLKAEHARMETELAARLAERDAAAAKVAKPSLASFESIRKARGIAVTEMRDGRCAICQMSLRPQVAQVVRRNDTVTKCDSCGRILFYVPPPMPPAATDAAPNA